MYFWPFRRSTKSTDDKVETQNGKKKFSNTKLFLKYFHFQWKLYLNIRTQHLPWVNGFIISYTIICPEISSINQRKRNRILQPVSLLGQCFGCIVVQNGKVIATIQDWACIYKRQPICINSMYEVIPNDFCFKFLLTSAARTRCQN